MPMWRNERQRSAEQQFAEQQRAVSCKKAFFWFIKRLIFFAILVAYTVIGAYTFQVSLLYPG